MLDKIKTTLRRLWEGACQDAPGRPSCVVDDRHFMLTVNGAQESWPDICKAAGAPGHADQVIGDGVLVCTWPSHADAIFGEGGLLSQHLPNYEVRAAQLHMARLVQRAIEMREPAVIEAGTGTGKSFAYAAICMAMDKRVVISTSNKALQMQLYNKDIPFLQKLFPDKVLALAVGKNNYVCRKKVEDLGAGAWTISGPLLDWYQETETGNTEEIPFSVEWQELKEIAVDNYCTGKLCSHYHNCFYYEAKAKRQEADVLVCNHMLLALDQAFPGAGILPDADVIVVDEAHKLPDYMRKVYGEELNLDRINARIALAEKYDVPTTMAQKTRIEFVNEIERAIRSAGNDQREIMIAQDTEIPEGEALALELYRISNEVWFQGDLPNNAEEIRKQRDADSLWALADALHDVSNPTRKKYVRWIEQESGAVLVKHVPFDVSKWMGELAGFYERELPPVPDHTYCRRCGRKLSADTVAILDGAPYGPDCILREDPFGDAERMPLSDWLALDHSRNEPPIHLPTPVVFTSATLAAPDMSSFLREAGLPDALQMIAASPFDYEHNTLLYVPPAAAPKPNHEDYRSFLIGQLRHLVSSAQGGAFLLFTSYANMRFAEQELRHEFEQAGYLVLRQGELPKLEISKRFVADENAVLFATKSFWEGVSVDGQALRMVVVDKLPFEPPSPLNSAQEEALREWARGQGMTPKAAQWYPFEALRVPKMIIELKQGTGRLIRTATDYGVIAVLDSRLRSAQYARQLVLPALPPAPLAHDVARVAEFYREHAANLAELSPVERFGYEAGHDPLNLWEEAVRDG